MRLENILKITALMLVLSSSLSIYAMKTDSSKYGVKKIYKQKIHGIPVYKDSTFYFLRFEKNKEDSINIFGMVSLDFQEKGSGFLSDANPWMIDSFYICLDTSNNHVYLKDEYCAQKNKGIMSRDCISDLNANMNADSFSLYEGLADARLLFSSKESLLSSYVNNCSKYFDYREIYRQDSSRIELVQLKVWGVPGFEHYIIKPSIPIRKYEMYRCFIVRKYNHLNQCTSVFIREATEDILYGLVIEYIAFFDLEM